MKDGMRILWAFPLDSQKCPLSGFLFRGLVSTTLSDHSIVELEAGIIGFAIYGVILRKSFTIPGFSASFLNKRVELNFL